MKALHKPSILYQVVAVMLTLCLGLPGPGHSQYVFNHLNDLNGLPSNGVHCMLRDADGFIWLGTDNGLCRFDGSETVVFQHDPMDANSLCDNNIRALYQDRTGLIWIGTIRGVSAYDPAKYRFVNYFHDPDEAGSLSYNSIQVITSDKDGNILIANDGHGIDLFDPATETFTQLLPSKQVDYRPERFVNTCISATADPHDNDVTWFGTLHGVLRYHSPTREFRHFSFKRENAADPSLFSDLEHTVRDILVDDDGKLWLATWGGGLCHFNPEDGTFDIYKYEPLRPVNAFRNNIVKLRRKSSDEIWALARPRGVAVFNTTTRQFTFLTHADNSDELRIMPSDMITGENGFMWLSTTSHGLLFTNINAQQFSIIHYPHPLRGIATCPPADGMIYTGITGTYGKFVVFDARTEHFSSYGYKPLNDRSENYFQGFFCGKERLWLIENFNLYWWDDRQQKVRLYKAFDPAGASVAEIADIPYLISGAESPAGELWIGSKFHGIFRIIPETGQVINYYYPDRATSGTDFENFVQVIYPDSKGRIWYSSTDFGYFDPDSQRFVNFSLGRDFPEAPVRSAIVTAITETPDGLIWLGTVNSGIQVIDPGPPATFSGYYMSHNDLAGSNIHHLITDDNGDVWAVTDQGLSRIIPSSGTVENFGPEYGLPRPKQLARLGSGEIVLLADNGLCFFDPDEVRTMKFEIKPYISTFRIFDRVAGHDAQLRQMRRINLEPDENFFSIEYGAINYFSPEKTVFSYKLEGLDENWTMAGKRKYVSYTNLPGGTYTFRLRASDGSDNFSEVSLPLFIKTPFWKTVWFYILVIIFLSAAIYGFFRFRMRQVRKQEEIRADYDKMINQLEMKALRAQMNPHFLFNSLNSIRYYILKEEFDNATEYLTQFSKLLRLILKNSRQNTITLAEELETVNIYIKFEQMRFGKGFEYISNIGDDVRLPEIMIQPMTIQPFVENAIWHGLMPKENDRRLMVSIMKDGPVLKIVIEDNGIGRTAARLLKQETDLNESRSYGMQITGERFKMLQRVRGKRSDYEIEDLTDQDNQPAGTRVTIYYEI
ncbi:MAG: two-component regulator propeller domain-containing protein [Bacteroidales bacterium]